ncbi:hypothetical protein BP5796_01905 [Coleophoma crateriformis]|uniref:PHD-type domain-containing protein n=1 Tax=Coleophoma crateriformis TaxID=565419 RepID=A0A3D8T256_9HELO|nr:hypothetical protein BP5796_01905 [Coleophoma crateriformis]
MDSSPPPMDSTLSGAQPVEAATQPSPAPLPLPTPPTNTTPFKYKYSEAAPNPFPDEVSDAVWNKIYTAADSRIYNKNNKSAIESRKIRQKGFTRDLAIQMCREKLAQGLIHTDATGSTVLARSLKSQPTKKQAPEPSSSSRDATPTSDKMAAMSISEQIKSEGRNRKAVSVGPSTSSNQGTPGPSSAPTVPKMSPTKPDKPSSLKRKGTATVVKKPKKPKNQTRVNTPSGRDGQTPASNNFMDDDGDSDSNDGGEYCICRGPDDHRMMVNCEGGCDDWFHCSCIGMDIADAKELLDRFICDTCKTDEKFTTWKRMCRNVKLTGCRKACRPNADPPSKFCSDECKYAWGVWTKRNRFREEDIPSMGGALNVSEVEEILTQCQNMTDLELLGRKPRLAMRDGADPSRPVGLDYLTPEEKDVMAEYTARQEKIQEEIKCIKGQLELLTMLQRRAKAAIGHPLSPHKTPCGFDGRATFNDAQFNAWRETAEGIQAFKTESAGPRTKDSLHINRIEPLIGEETPLEPDLPAELKGMCLNSAKKCRHGDWYEMCRVDAGFRIKNLRDEFKKLQNRTDFIIDDAETREATKDYDAHNTVEQLF